VTENSQLVKLNNALKSASFAATLSWIGWVPRLPDIKDHLGLSLDQLGTILMISGLTLSVASRPTAALIHHFNSKRVIVLGIAISLVGNLVIATAASGLWLAIGLIVTAFGVGLVNTGNNTQINSLSVLTGENKRNRLSAYSTIGTLSSLILGALLLNVLSTFVYLMLIQAIAIFLGLLSNRAMLDIDQGAAKKGEKAVRMPWFGKGMLPFWFALAALYGTTLAEFSVSDWGGLLARDNFHIGAPWFLVVILFFQLGMFFGRFLSDRLNKRFGEVKNVMVGTLSGAAIWAIGIYAAAEVGKQSATLALVVASFGFFCAGWGIGPNWGVLISAATVPGYPPPVSLARIFGLLSLVFSFGPGLVGWLARAVGLENAMLLPIICLALVGLLVPKIVASDRRARELLANELSSEV
jgi:predicted MFS family arabinose efflux permease